MKKPRVLTNQKKLSIIYHRTKRSKEVKLLTKTVTNYTT